jgi:hypothetical protein
VFYVALIFFIGLAINAKSGVDRVIYGALAAAAVTALSRGIPAASQLAF